MYATQLIGSFGTSRLKENQTVFTSNAFIEIKIDKNFAPLFLFVNFVMLVESIKSVKLSCKIVLHRRKDILVKDSKKSDWIVIVKSVSGKSSECARKNSMYCTYIIQLLHRNFNLFETSHKIFISERLLTSMVALFYANLNPGGRYS